MTLSGTVDEDDLSNHKGSLWFISSWCIFRNCGYCFSVGCANFALEGNNARQDELHELPPAFPIISESCLWELEPFTPMVDRVYTNRSNGRDEVWRQRRRHSERQETEEDNLWCGERDQLMQDSTRPHL